MIRIQTIGRRRLEIVKLSDGKYEVKIILTGSEKRLATLLIEPVEMEKIKELFNG